jgi:hypothetical protein
MEQIFVAAICLLLGIVATALTHAAVALRGAAVAWWTPPSPAGRCRGLVDAAVAYGALPWPGGRRRRLRGAAVASGVARCPLSAAVRGRCVSVWARGLRRVAQAEAAGAAVAPVAVRGAAGACVGLRCLCLPSCRHAGLTAF